MSATLTHPDVGFERPVMTPRFLAEHFEHEAHAPSAAQESSLAGSMLRGAILVALGAGTVTLLLFSLVPAVFVTLLFFLPALLPFVLLGLAIVFEDDVCRNRDRREAAAEQPCSCHRDRVLS